MVVVVTVVKQVMMVVTVVSKQVRSQGVFQNHIKVDIFTNLNGRLPGAVFKKRKRLNEEWLWRQDLNEFLIIEKVPAGSNGDGPPHLPSAPSPLPLRRMEHASSPRARE